MAPFEVKVLIFLLIYITCKGVPRRLPPVGRALGTPGGYLRACEGFARRFTSRLSVALLSPNLAFDVSSSGLDVVVMLEVPGSLPFLSVWRMPTIWADVSKSSRPRGLGTVVGSLLGGLLGSLPL